ncbi:hypothetical protein ABFS82_11G009400 [Erythranthe guttata]
MIQGRRVCAKLLREITLLKRVLSLVFVQKIAFGNRYTEILQRTYTSQIVSCAETETTFKVSSPHPQTNSR